MEIVNASTSGLCIATASSLAPGDGVEVSSPQSAAVDAAVQTVIELVEVCDVPGHSR